MLSTKSKRRILAPASLTNALMGRKVPVEALDIAEVKALLSWRPQLLAQLTTQEHCVCQS